MEIFVLIGMLIVSAAALYAGRRWGVRVGLSRPTEAAKRQLDNVNGQIEARNRQLHSLDRELERLSPLRVRVAQIHEQEESIRDIKDAIRHVQQRIAILTRAISGLQMEIASRPQAARVLNQEEQLTALLNQKLGLEHTLPELRMNFAAAQTKLVQMTDELATKRLDLLNA